MAHVHSIQAGRVAPLGPEAVPSGFVKTAVPGPVEVRALGLSGDEQADMSVHGGPEKAVYAYALDHYAVWQADLPHHAAALAPGAFGENLTIAGLDEAALRVGDVHAIGTALLQVCQPRQPCFKLALRFQDNRLPRAMTKTGRSGWYYRVLREGTIAPGDAVTLAERPNPDFPFATLVGMIGGKGASTEDLVRLASAAGVARQWQVEARRMLRALKEQEMR